MGVKSSIGKFFKFPSRYVPKVIPPRQNGLTRKPEWPRVMYELSSIVFGFAVNLFN
jgi:hypothetical protein